MNIIYIIFIIIILFSFITGLFVTIAEKHERKRYNDLLEEEADAEEEKVVSVQNIVPEVPIIMEDDSAQFTVSNTNNVQVGSVVNSNQSINDIPEIITEKIPVANNYTTSSLPVLENVSDVEDNYIIRNNNIDSTIKLDDIEVLEKTIKLNYIQDSNFDLNVVSPQLVPYSIVDDDII